MSFTAMYLNLVQIAESFGVSEKVVEDWVRAEGLPHTDDRGRLLFDRAQVAAWAASRGLAAQAGFLAPSHPTQSTGWRLEALLRAGGIWRDVAAAELPSVIDRVVAVLPGATPPARQMLAQRLRAKGGITIAPTGHGFAVPHPTTRIALGRESGIVALVLLRDPLVFDEPQADDVPVTRLVFFIAPSPRAHLDLLARLGRLISRGPLRGLIDRGASDEEIFAAAATADVGPALVPKEGPT
jgi:PTS system nitrogen regulatory IIA component